VIVLADAREQPFFEDLITRLDGKADPNTRNEVIFLQHADARTWRPSSSRSSPAEFRGAEGGGPVRPPRRHRNGRPAGANANASTAGRHGHQRRVQQLCHRAARRAQQLDRRLGTLDDIRLIRDLVDKIDAVLPR